MEKYQNHLSFRQKLLEEAREDVRREDPAYLKLANKYKDLKEKHEKAVKQLSELLEAIQVVENIEMFQKMKDEVRGECVSFAAMYSENITMARELTALKAELHSARMQLTRKEVIKTVLY